MPRPPLCIRERTSTLLKIVESREPARRRWLPVLERMEYRCLLTTPGVNTWMDVAPLPDTREGEAVVSGPDGRIYAISGETDSGVTSEVDAYDPDTNAWTVVAPLPDARSGLGAATGPDGRIYAIGGYIDVGPTGATGSSEVDAYDPKTNTWTVMAPLPSARADAYAATGPDGRIYAVGGIILPANGDGPGVASEEVDAYDTATNAWTAVASMPSARVGFAVTAGPDGRIYALGGFIEHSDGDISSSTEVDAYDTNTDTWATVAPLPDGTYDFAAATGADGRVYAIGGITLDNDVNAYTNAVYAYDPSSNEWASAPALLNSEQSLGATSGPDGNIYAVGGDNLDDDSYSSEVEVLDLAPKAGIVATTPTFSPTDGGVDFGYTISESDLTHRTTVDLDWASGTTVHTVIGDPIVSTTTETAQGTYDLHKTPGELGAPPPGATDLLVVADPSNTISPADPSKVAALELPDLHPDSFNLNENASDGGGVDFSLEEDDLPLPESTTVGIYWADGPNPSDTLEPIGQPVWSENVPAGDLGVGPLVSVDAEALGIPPAGTTGLMVVADPSKKLELSASDSNFQFYALFPALIFDSSVVTLVAQPSGTGSTNGITATFEPASGALTLAQAASILKVDHFNWVQYIEGPLPAHWKYFKTTNGHKTRIDPPFLDPVEGYPRNRYVITDTGHVKQHSTRIGIEPAELRYFTPSNGTYYSESEGVKLVQLNQFTNLNHRFMLGFGDAPTRKPGWFGKNNTETLDFKTTLVGITKTGSVMYFPDYGQTFRWGTNGTQTTLL